MYLIHCPVSFAKGSKVGEDLLPLTGGNLPDGDVKIDDSISIIDTWKGEHTQNLELDAINAYIQQ